MQNTLVKSLPQFIQKIENNIQLSTTTRHLVACRKIIFLFQNLYAPLLPQQQLLQHTTRLHAMLFMQYAMLTLHQKQTSLPVCTIVRNVANKYHEVVVSLNQVLTLLQPAGDTHVTDKKISLLFHKIQQLRNIAFITPYTA